MTDTEKRLQMILGSAAFDALKAYLDERDCRCADVTFSGAEVRNEAGELTHVVDEQGVPQSIGRVITRTLTDSIRTKDGMA